MKHIFILLAATILLTSCIETKKEAIAYDGYQITLSNLKSWANNRKARIVKVENRKRIVIDSIIVNNGGGTFRGKTNLAGKHYITFDNKRGVIDFILSNETIKIIVNNEDPKNSKILNSAQNDAVETYNKESEFLRNFISDLSNKNQVALKNNDTLLQRMYKKSYDSISKKGLEFDKLYISRYPNKVNSANILERLFLSKTITKEEVKHLLDLLKADALNSISVKNIKSKLNN